MSMSMAGFGRAITALGKDLEKRASLGMTSAVADELLSELRGDTPVESGNLRDAWKKERATSRRRGQYIVGVQQAKAGYANVILPGRRRGKSGHMVGSVQSGRGHIARRVMKRVRARLQKHADNSLGGLFR